MGNTAKIARSSNFKLLSDSSNGLISDSLVSICDNYIYTTSRIWELESGVMCIVIACPFRFRGNDDNSTIRACMKIATILGYGGVHIVPLFAHVVHEYKELESVEDPVGHSTDKIIEKAITGADVTLAGWGDMGTKFDRHIEVIRALPKKKNFKYLGLTGKFNPKTPTQIKTSEMFLPLIYAEATHSMYVEILDHTERNTSPLVPKMPHIQ